ncbi:hypothetical protein ElyMa_001093800 [Elysia marginata]|uniref:MADF domain-containing protein n=1 Tax=Elysia marginata TaxID=1093978 RepID=A0AAV4HX36_9GAST|nr:hypothetical protein ElyMa_001093800 [Elysia marginata]
MSDNESQATDYSDDEEAQETWTKLRNNFAKVLARRKAKNPSGSAASGPFRRWTYEAEMEFLKAHMSQPRVMSSSIRASSSSPAPPTSSVHEDLPMSVPAREGHDFTSEPMPAQTLAREPTPAPATAPTPRQRKSPGPEAVDQARIAYVNSVTNQTEDPLVMWFKSLVPTLKSLSPDQLPSFQIRTMQDIQRLSYTPERGAEYQTYQNYASTPPNLQQQYNMIQCPLPSSYEQEHRNYTL